MPLSLLVAEAVNAVMPMINHLAMRQNGQNQQRVEQWVKLLQIRLNRVEEAENLPEVVSHHEISTTGRESETLEATIRRGIGKRSRK
jgi:hypothetical protein